VYYLNSHESAFHVVPLETTALAILAFRCQQTLKTKAEAPLSIHTTTFTRSGMRFRPSATSGRTAFFVPRRGTTVATEPASVTRPFGAFKPTAQQL